MHESAELTHTVYETMCRKMQRTMEYAGVYVLKLEGLPYTHFVGRSETVLAQIAEHRRGNGPACTVWATSIEEVPLLTEPVMEGGKVNLEAWERTETLALMRAVGIDKVRGWHFKQPELAEEHYQTLRLNICFRNNLCPRCGFTRHGGEQCLAPYRAHWMGSPAF
jgi:hypothetical protein